MTVLEQIEAELERSGELTLASIGDPADLWRDKDAVAVAPVASQVVDLVCREWSNLGSAEATVFVLAVVRQTERALALSDALDSLLSSEPVLQEIGQELGLVLLERAGGDRPEQVDIATRALEGALRLVLGGWSDRRLELLLTLSQFESPPNPFEVSRLCRLIGITDEQWPTNELVQRLDKEVEAGDRTGDASFELGLAQLRRALAGDQLEDILSGLSLASAHLRAAQAAVEGRTDAEAYEIAIEAIVSYAQHRDASTVMSAANGLRDVLIGRAMWRAVDEGSWLAPRAEAELEWHRLVGMLARSAQAFETPTPWLTPPIVLAQLAETYSASRSVRLFTCRENFGGAVDQLIEPRLEFDFLQHAHRVELLAEWLQSDEITEDERNAAAPLLARLQAGGSKKAPR